ncbi:universal stress protein [Streptomyces xanthii]|uniref:Universal stress protein n=1 Tax=Streptomyces xanthii TaxID=2768069 RepID=A0A7H1B0R3_9ACTN|nr:universal stress protein [Streptomyces xanthii]QNS02318.1 universal stress protein [Streptomyces xanthii]
MTAQVTVGVDGSAESLAAARWAAREAVVREVPLRLVCVEEWPGTPEMPLPYARTVAERTDVLLRDEAARARRRHPGLEVFTEQARGRAAEELRAAADEADLMVLGSRGLGSVSGFVIGSVSLAVAGTARRPVVLVRADGDASAAPSGRIVVGLDMYDPCEDLLAFSFAEAARRKSSLGFLHSWTLPAYYGAGAVLDPRIAAEVKVDLEGRLDELLAPWRERFPDVKATAVAVEGPVADQLIDASRDAELVIVGRRSRKLPVGPRLGHVAHALIHHSPVPVAVVPFE